MDEEDLCRMLKGHSEGLGELLENFDRARAELIKKALCKKVHDDTTINACIHKRNGSQK